MPTSAASPLHALEKCPTGIQGLDEVTGGGLPRGRPTLVCGSAGCGKTMLAAEFLYRGATEFGEPGVFMAFEETADDLTVNLASLGFDLPGLQEQKLLAMDHVRVERSEIEETGEYDLEGLFVRLGYAIDSVGAKRVVLDTVESLFSGFSNENILRAELRRLFGWLKDRGVTAIITGESGEKTLTRHGMEEYVSDCVIVLDNRVTAQLSTRRLRVVKYRGSAHGSNEYPFTITEHGFSVVPVTSLGLTHEALTERLAFGVPDLDVMLGGGIYRGASVLISGGSGTAKSSLSAAFAAETCRRGEPCLYLSFEESPSQIVRNMRSIGMDLAPFVDQGLLHLHSSRATLQGLEAHLVSVYDLIRQFQPRSVVFDPATALLSLGSDTEVKAMLLRVVDLLKSRGITSVFTHLTTADSPEHTETEISSLMDTWLLVRVLETDGERTRGLYVLKSRGVAHSNQVRELVLSDEGLRLTDVYVGPGTVLTGSARVAQEARDAAAAEVRDVELRRLERQLDAKRQELEARIAALRSEFELEEEDVRTLIARSQAEEEAAASSRRALAQARDFSTHPDSSPPA